MDIASNMSKENFTDDGGWGKIKTLWKRYDDIIFKLYLSLYFLYQVSGKDFGKEALSYPHLLLMLLPYALWAKFCHQVLFIFDIIQCWNRVSGGNTTFVSTFGGRFVSLWFKKRRRYFLHNSHLISFLSTFDERFLHVIWKPWYRIIN